MDLLCLGISPEILSQGREPPRLTTLRLGSPVPARPWDAVLVRGDDVASGSVGSVLDAAVGNLRHGGLVVVVHADPEAGDAAPWVRALQRQGCRPLRDGPDGPMLLVVARRAVPGQLDLVGLRRSVRVLESHVERLEGLLGRVPDRFASMRPVEGGWSLKELTGHLGDLDRDGYVPAIRRILRGSDEAALPFDADRLIAERHHNDRQLAELVTRFRHFRAQSMEQLESLRDSQWLARGRGPDGSPATVAELVREWCRSEEEVLATLRERTRTLR